MQAKRLVGAKDWFGFFAEGSPSAAFLLANGAVLHANSAASALCGFRGPAAMNGLHMRTFLEPELAAEIEALAQRRQPHSQPCLELAGAIKTAARPAYCNIAAWTSELDSEPLVVLRALPEGGSQLQERLARTDREYRLLSATLELLLTAQSEAELLNEFCRQSVKLAGYKMAWVGFARADAEKTIEPVAHAGLDDEYFGGLRFSWTDDDPQYGKGPSGTAVRTGRPCVMRDLLNNPLYLPWREAAVKRGYTEAASFPLALGNERGVFNLCDGGAGAFDNKEVLLLEQVASALSLGILSLRHSERLGDALEKLRSAKELITAFLEHSPLSFCATQTDGRILMANPRWREMFGCRELPQPYTPVAELVGEECARYLDGICREVVQAHKALSFEHKVKLPQGSRHLRATSFPLRDRDGRVTGIGCISEDITDRLRAMRLIRASQRRLENAERVAGLGNYEYSFETGRAIWSRNMYRVYGSDPDDRDAPTIKNVTDKLVLPEDRERFLADLEAAGQSEGQHESEYRVRWPDGQVRHLLARRISHRNADGRILRMTGIVQDITDIRLGQAKLAESTQELKYSKDNLRRANVELESTSRQLSESEQRYLNVVEQAPDGIAIAFQGKIIFCNSALARIAGFETSAELLGRPFASLLDEPERAKLLDAMVRLREIGQVSPLIEARGLRNDGKKPDLAVRLALVERDGSAAVQATISDVSQHRKLERQVQQMQKMEAVGMLAGGIAHDFNNILFGILGYADLVRDRLEQDPEAREDLDELCKAAQRGRDLVGQLLLFTRQAERALRPLKLTAAIREALRFLRATLPATISITTVLEEDNDTVLGDPTELHQVLMNLSTNAMQAMPDGGELEISVQALAVDEDFAAAHQGLSPGPTLLVRISDTGTGMSPETAARVFDPFFTTKEQGQGTGLGLSVVYGIIKAMGGTIHVYSELGHGTSFHIYLPLQAEAGAAAPSEAQPPAALGGSERLMVVDDDEGLMRMVGKILSRLGYEVETYSNSQAALAAFRAEPDKFQLIFTDHTMPGLTGLQFARAALHLRPRLPVVLATGFAHHNLGEEALLAGIARVVTKPLVATDLAAAVRAALDAAGAPKPRPEA